MSLQVSRHREGSGANVALELFHSLKKRERKTPQIIQVVVTAEVSEGWDISLKRYSTST